MQFNALDDCLAHLPGFELQPLLDWSAEPPQPFVAATRHFRVAYKINTTLPRYQLAEILRLYSVNKFGGYYLDADGFVLSPRFLDHLSCPFVLSSDVLNAPNGEYMPATPLLFPPNATVPTPSQAVVRACGGVFAGAANSSFGRAQWAYFATCKFWYFDAHTSDWPFSFASADAASPTPNHPLRISTAMRPALRTFDALPTHKARERTADEWRDYVHATARDGVHALHLTWMAQRIKARQAVPLMRAILEHVMRIGAPHVAPAHERCAKLARRLLDIADANQL